MEGLERRPPCRRSSGFLGALDELAWFWEPVNRVLEVDIEGGEVTFKLYDFPADSP